MTSGANCFYQLLRLYLLRTSGSTYVILKKGGERGHELLLVSVPMYSSYLQCAVFEIVRCVECRRGRSRLSLMRFYRGCSIYRFSLYSHYLRDACVNWQSLQFRNSRTKTSDSTLISSEKIHKTFWSIWFLYVARRSLAISLVFNISGSFALMLSVEAAY